MAVTGKKTGSSGLNAVMMEAALRAVKESGAAALVLFVDAVEDRAIWKDYVDNAEGARLILVTQKPEDEEPLAGSIGTAHPVVKLPPVRLTRIGQIKLATIISLTEGILKGTDTVVCLSGTPDAGSLDTLIVLDLSRETDIVITRGLSKDLFERVKPEVFETALNIAIELASEGREGRAIGSIFVIGDTDHVLELSRPLIMNPFRGYPEGARNLLDDAVHETLKEFSLLDGAFVIRGDGVVESAGTHLDAALSEGGLTPGLGSRHMAAAGITDVTEALAITISGSTGVIRIFRKGRIFMEIERPSRPHSELMTSG